MKVLLLSNVKGVGQKGDIKEVSEGYARNLLIPRGLAQFATETIQKELSKLSRDKQEHTRILTEKIQEEIIEISGREFVLVLKANEKGALFAKFTTEDFLKHLQAQGFKHITTKHLHIADSPLKELGTYKVKLNEGKITAECNLVLKS